LRNRLSASVFESKLVQDLGLMVSFTKIMASSGVADLLRVSIPILVAVFAARAIANGSLIPYAVSYVVNAFKERNGDGVLATGIGLFTSAAVIFLVTEFSLLKYFRRLTDAIVGIKRTLISNISRVRSAGDSPEDLVGKIANDIDFIVWNINGVLTTLLPNAFTSAAALATVFGFSHSVGAMVALSLAPYIVLAEVYSRRVEVHRMEERRSYSTSLVLIKDLVYGGQDSGIFEKTMGMWRSSVLKILWYDRLYWGLGLFAGFASMGVISYLSIINVRRGSLDVGSLAGILTASLSAHTGMLNAMWAMCVQGQTSAAIKRILKYSSYLEKPAAAVKH